MSLKSTSIVMWIIPMDLAAKELTNTVRRNPEASRKATKQAKRGKNREDERIHPKLVEP